MKRQALGKASATRMSTKDGTTLAEESCGVAVETTLTIDVLGGGSYGIMCSPGEGRALAVGFLRTEGIIRDVADVLSLAECPDAPGVLVVVLSQEATEAALRRGGRIVVSACGSCGSDDLAGRLARIPPVGDAMRIGPALLGSMERLLFERQELFRECGGTHAACVFDGEGSILAFAEDIGRHNALDKAVGRCMLGGISTVGCGAMLSGRLSFEMIDKCARAGIEVMGAVSAPTSLAIEAAEKAGITLCAFVREARASIFTHPRRIQRSTPPEKNVH
ncbi:MAG: formate dehydrogenase accessory sulfurtransferase FdhD [Deltaproteobacteria bacterium]|nr:formate dehydrogenase accessory sulfurtransferase FdhD [Deltaproteobacteria bacterium]